MTAGISDLELNAFVDGELSPDVAARVASCIAADPKIAQRVAALYRMKAAISGMADDLPLPDLPQSGASRVPVWRMAVGLAGIAAVLVLLLWSLPSLGPASGPAQQAIGLPLLAQHDRWAANEAGEARIALPDGADWLGSVMIASGLQLVHRTRIAEVEHFGFQGRNGCRISLFVTDQRSADSPLRFTLTEHVQHAEWQIGAFGFEMIARDMAPVRFLTVATSLHRNSHDHAPDATSQIALMRAARLPCRT
jgi:hypothetical protein